MRARLAFLALGILCGVLPSTVLLIPKPRAVLPRPVRPATQDVAEWYSYLAAQRQFHLAILDQYMEEGCFPINQELQFTSTPIFIDASGTSCAVAHLMQKDGWVREAKQIAGENNIVRVMDVRDGPLHDWIATSGFTREECALIQPRYDWEEIARRHREKVRKYLRGVLQTIRQETHRSLEISCRRLIASFPQGETPLPRGFHLARPGAQERTFRIDTNQPLEARISLLDGEGRPLREGSWIELSSQSPFLSAWAEARHDWWLVEWRCRERMASDLKILEVQP